MRPTMLWFTAIGVVAVIATPVLATPSSLGSLIGDACSEAGAAQGVCDGSTQSRDVSSYLANIVSFLLMVVGVLSVVMIIVAAIRITTSAGDSNKLTSGKNTLLYAIIGLAVSALAFAIVNFVVGEFSYTAPRGVPPGTGGMDKHRAI